MYRQPFHALQVKSDVLAQADHCGGAFLAPHLCLLTPLRTHQQNSADVYLNSIVKYDFYHKI
jgi:hypothetical protein